MSHRPRVLVTRRLPARIEAALVATYDVVLNDTDTPWTREDFGRAWGEADAVVCTVSDRISAEALPPAPTRTKLLANFGVGYNHIALDAARAADILVTNTPDVLTDDTADLAIALMLATLRRLSEGERELREGRWTGWRPTHHLGRRLTGKTLGIIGYGRIGQAVAQRAHRGFGMPVLWWAPRAPATGDVSIGRRVESLDELLAASDVVSLHCPASTETRHLLNADRLAQLRPTAVLINTARGDVVDEAALIDALQSGRIAAAGLDVYEREPVVPEALLALPNVVLFPHLGSATIESREAMGERVLVNLQAFFATGVVPDRVM